MHCLRVRAWGCWSSGLLFKLTLLIGIPTSRSWSPGLTDCLSVCLCVCVGMLGTCEGGDKVLSAGARDCSKDSRDHVLVQSLVEPFSSRCCLTRRARRPSPPPSAPPAPLSQRTRASRRSCALCLPSRRTWPAFARTLQLRRRHYLNELSKNRTPQFAPLATPETKVPSFPIHPSAIKPYPRQNNFLYWLLNKRRKRSLADHISSWN